MYLFKCLSVNRYALYTDFYSDENLESIQIYKKLHKTILENLENLAGFLKDWMVLYLGCAHLSITCLIVRFSGQGRV